MPSIMIHHMANTHPAANGIAMSGMSSIGAIGIAMSRCATSR